MIAEDHLSGRYHFWLPSVDRTNSELYTVRLVKGGLGRWAMSRSPGLLGNLIDWTARIGSKLSHLGGSRGSA